MSDIFSSLMGMAGGSLGSGIGGALGGLFSPSTPSDSAMLKKSLKLLEKYYPQLNAFSEQQYGQNAQFSLGQMQQYAPQLAQLQMQLQQKYGLPMAQEQQAESMALNPQYYAMRNALGNQIQGQIGQGLSPQQTQYFTNQLNAGQAARGMYGSPLSSVNTALALTPLNMQQQQQNIANASNFLGNYNMSGTANVGIPGGNQMPNLQSSLPNVQQQYGDISNLVTNSAMMNYGQQQGQANQMGGLLGGMGSMGGLLGGYALGGGFNKSNFASWI